MVEILNVIFWFTVSFLFVVSLSIGLVLLLTDEDRLIYNYQNYQLRKTGKSLKDEHFGDMEQFVSAVRLLGTSLIGVDLIIFGWLLFAWISSTVLAIG